MVGLRVILCPWVQVFLEPEGRTTPELYVQGFSTGLPERLQLALLHTLPGTQPPFSPLPPWLVWKKRS